MHVDAIIDTARIPPGAYIYQETPRGIPIKWILVDITDYKGIREAIISYGENPDKWFKEHPDILKAIMDYAFERKIWPTSTRP